MPPGGDKKGGDKKGGDRKGGDKKPDKPAPAEPVSNSAIFEIVIGIIVVLALGSALLSRLVAFLTGQGDMSGEFLRSLSVAYARYKVLAAYVSFLLMIVVGYLVRNITRIRTEERRMLYPEKEAKPEQVANAKWQRIVDHLESDNVNDWKLAIIEADIILGDMLASMGYHGDTIGEKLKAVERSDFLSIDKAWEAHKVRNLIAHEGADFQLNKREAVRIIALYKDVFEEFYYI